MTPDRLPETSSVAIFPCSVRGSPSLGYLRDGMVSLLSPNLNGAGRIYSIGPGALLRALDQPQGDVWYEAAARVGSRFGAELLRIACIRAGTQPEAAPLHAPGRQHIQSGFVRQDDASVVHEIGGFVLRVGVGPGGQAELVVVTVVTPADP